MFYHEDMKVTRFPQSCLLLEQDGHAIVIDPGVHFLKTHTIDELKGVGAVLYTHQHSDHYDPAIAKALLEAGVPIYANAATDNLIDSDKVTVVHDGDMFTAGGFEVIARELPHCLLVDGSKGPQNTGYVVNGAFFHPGDGKELEGLKVDNLALPITGPDISMHDAFAFARQVQAKVVIPIHYQAIPADPTVFASYIQKGGAPGFEVRVLADGQSTEVS